MRQQQDLLGAEGSKYNVEFLSNGSDKHQHQGKDLDQSTVMQITMFSDYEPSQEGVQEKAMSTPGFLCLCTSAGVQSVK